MDIQKIKEEIRMLYNNLEREIGGEIALPSGRYFSPNAVSYCQKAHKLVEKVEEYSKLDKDFVIAPVIHTLDKEVSYVYNYDGKRKSEKKQREELEKLMREATHKLYIDLLPLLIDDATLTT